MPTRKYVPRSFFKNDIDFGDSSRQLVWRDRADWPPGSTPDWAAASWTQHLVSSAMRDQVAARYPSTRAFTDAAAINYDRFGRVTRGEYIMTLDDVALATRLLGVELTLVAGPPRAAIASGLTRQRDAG